MAYQQNERYFSIETPLGKDALLLQSFNGEERLSGLFRFHLEMNSEDQDLDFKKIVGKPVTISVRLESEDEDRYIHGVVGRFIQSGLRGRFAVYYAEVHPWLWLLTMSSDCRIFQEMKAPDIIKKVFSDLGHTDFKDDLAGTYTEREYCVQYNETNFAFVSRLMEEEGISYFFKHEKGKHTLILADDPSSCPPCKGGDELRYGTFDLNTQQKVVSECTYEEHVIAGDFATRDYNFETPSTGLGVNVSSAEAQNGSKRKLYEFPGRYHKKDAGEGVAKIRLEEREAPKMQLQGRAQTAALTAGGKFKLTDHYASKVNGEYILSRVAHSAEEDTYSNSFSGFPADLVWRPPRIHPRPRIAGMQTAVVVGKSGEEIWTDKHGRVKVQFHWDREGKSDENSSCWVRVSHLWAGKSWGQISIPRIGQEVVVSFEEGDPDRPLITGRVYNADQPVPYPLPANQTKSTMMSRSSKKGGKDNYNELRFEDKKDEEEIYFQAERDFNRVVKNNDTLKVGLETKDAGDQTIEIQNKRTTTLYEGDDTLTLKKGNQKLDIQKGKRDVYVKGAVSHKNDDVFNHDVKGDYTLKIKGNLQIDVTGSVMIKAGTTLKLKAGTSLATESGTDMKNKAGTNLSNDAGVKIENKAVMVSIKGSAKADVTGGGMLALKGAMLKLN